MLGDLKRRWRALRHEDEADGELEEELRYHLEREAEQNVRAGMSPEEARAAALKAFGGLEQARERCREARGVRMIQDLWMDLRYGARTLLKNPGFALVAVVTLALGVGANTAIFSVVNGVLLKSLDFPDADRLVAVYETSKEVPAMSVAFPNYLDWREGQNVFESLAARMPAGGVMTGDGEPERVIGRWVTASFFTTLGVRPRVGRFFTEEEDRPSAERVIVLSHALWQRRFGGDPSVVGRAVRYNAESWTVVGVMQPQFDFYGTNNLNNDFFIPLGRLADQDYMHSRSSHPLSVTGRLRPGVELERAAAEMRALAARLAAQFPESNADNGVEVRPFLDDYVGDARPPLLMLSVAVALVLLIACANVANLLLARATTRRKEIALRMALGAGRGRIVRQLLTESVLLAMAGGALGLLLAAWGVSAAASLSPNTLPRSESLSLDARAFGFTLLLTLVTGVGFGLAPALQTAKADFHAALKEGGLKATGGAGGRRLRGAFVVAEVALSLVLLVGAGLLVKSFWRLMQVDPGFDARGVLTLRLRLPDAKYREAAQSAAFLKEVSNRVRALPGVREVSITSGFPLGRSAQNGYLLEGQPEPRQPGEWPVAVTLSVDENYHRALGVALLAGRHFTDRDAADSAPVVMVDEDFVRRHFPGSPPAAALGKRLRFGGEGERWREIVGVTRHVRQNGPEEAGHPGIYRHWTQGNPKWAADSLRVLDLVVKTSEEPLSLVAPIRREVQAVDPDQALGNVRGLEDLLSESIAPRRFSLLLVGVFAAVALLLGAVGLYGVLSYVVTQRTREIGVRMALGARAGDVLRLVIKDGMGLALVGVGAGLVVSLALTRLMSGLLFGVSATDPLTFASLTLLLLFVALLACYLPARRATKIDPLVALRHE
ncbi:MAG TPA: ABC transporter permease [Pyrinomonadaceae bacterium]|jgi:putative ABC transport system permease protein|nr:ABC transporter permease [Pyrinomonadaceae bacterium]